MSFKRLEVSGFKSFADKLKVDFNPGITAIVGPNGCGKSNVGDAIRWVLGEQSPKSLRGSNMQDVIFKGSQNRKGLSFCEVSLVFDNAQKMFNTEYDELVLTRKLYRSGEREYALNHTPCLLKDITNILHDSGIARDGYSIIGQGKVEEIINSKPENRRAIFEEAAGIAKFKVRKEEAERKLERYKDNITRLSDIMSEIEHNLKPLQKQAENAKIYLQLRDELKILEVNSYLYQHDTTNEVKEAIQNKIDGYSQEVNLKTEQLNESSIKHNKSMETIKDIDRQIAEIREQILNLTVALEKDAGNYRLAQEKISYLGEQILRIKEELNQDKKRFAEISEELKTLQEQRTEKSTELNMLSSKVDEMQNIYDKVLNELEIYEKKVDNSQKQMMSEIDKISDIKAKGAKLELEKNNLFDRENELKARENSLKEKLTLSLKLENDAKKENQQAEDEQKKLKLDIEGLQSSRFTIFKEFENCRNNLSEFIKEQASLESKNRLLNEMHAEYEGFNGTVKKLLVDSGNNPKLKNSIVGVVAELIKVPHEYETAIEMALGSAVQNVVTTSEDDAKSLVSYLKTNNYGRATFLPINSLKPRYIADSFKSLLKTKGCYGVASELISFDAKLKPVFEGLLGSTVIVENMDVAVALAKQSKFSFKIVTLDGDIINPAGSITGGSKKTSINNLLSRDREIKEVAEKLIKVQKEIATQRELMAKCQNLLRDADQKLEQTKKQLQDCEIKLEIKANAYKSHKERNEEINQELNDISDELTRIAEKQKFLVDEIKNIEQLKKSEGVKGEKVDLTRNEQLRAKRAELGGTLTELKVQIASKQSALISINENIERLAQEQENLSESIDENESLLIKNTKTLESAQMLNANKDDENISEQKQKIAKLRDKADEMEGTKEQIHQMLQKIEEERERLNQELAKAQEKQFQEEAKLSQIDVNLENMKEKIYEDYELTYSTAQDLRMEDYDHKQSLARISEIKKDISKLGYVNVNAIEDSKVMEERYGVYIKEMDDLTKAENDVVLIIKDLNEQMTEKFEVAFNKINSNFTTIFKQLFGGGNARLVLTEGEDVLTAGVEIIAEPPGKKLQNLTLLSGGEKALTAIAILFAILRLRPMPFCLLDEIEAALDDANVERFAKYLHNFAEETQFIVITHRKPTMELADSLYGVTMEEEGVSKIVSVRLSEALKNVETQKQAKKEQ